MKVFNNRDVKGRMAFFLLLFSIFLRYYVILTDLCLLPTKSLSYNPNDIDSVTDYVPGLTCGGTERQLPRLILEFPSQPRLHL